MTVQQRGMLHDIRTCHNLKQLLALADLEPEFPGVFTPLVKRELQNRKRHLKTQKADKPSPATRVSQPLKTEPNKSKHSQLHVPGFLSRFCSFCRQRARLARARKGEGRIP